MKIRVFAFLCIAIIFFVVPGCFPSKKQAADKEFKNGDSWIPPGFRPQNSILLIQLLDVDAAPKSWQDKLNKWNQEMQDYMKEKYPYPYEFVNEDQIENPAKKFSDHSKYGFGLLISKGSQRYEGVAGKQVGDKFYNTATVYDFYFIDRATGKKYPLTKKYSSNPVMTFMPVINTILAKK